MFIYHNFIKNILLDHKIKFSKIDEKFIKESQSILNIDDVIKIILEQNLNTSDNYDFIMNCNTKLNDEIFENIDLYIFKYYLKKDTKDDKLLEYIFSLLYLKFKKDSLNDSLFIKLLTLCEKEEYPLLHKLTKNSFLKNKNAIDNISKAFIEQNKSIFDVESIIDFILNDNLSKDKIEELLQAFSDNDLNLEKISKMLLHYFYDKREKDLYLKKIY